MTEIESTHYGDAMKHLESLNIIGLVTTGRTGSDFLQSLFDGHEEVVGFNGHFLFYEEFVDKSLTLRSPIPDPRDVVDEFVGLFIYKLVSKYDTQEGKNLLGQEMNQFFRVDTTEFRRNFIGLVGNRPLTNRVCLLAIYGSFHMSIGRSILGTKVLFHHPHLEFEFRRFVSDFPKAKVVFTVRDLRANFVSHVENFKKYYPDSHDSEGHLAEVLNMGLRASELLDDLGLKSISVRLEDLPNPKAMESLSRWIGIRYEDSLRMGTWAGLAWNGDQLSSKQYQNVWTKNRTENNWFNRLSKRDKLILRCAGSRHLVHLHYESTRPSKSKFCLAFLLSVLPMSSELDFLKITYLWKRIQMGRNGLIQLADSPFSYYRRVRLTQSALLASMSDSPPTYDWIRIFE